MTARARLALAILALLAVVAITYRPLSHGAFIWDDHALVETNRVVQQGSFVDIFRQPFWTADPMVDVRPSYYRPLTILSFRWDYKVAGHLPNAAGAFHLTNLGLHLVAIVALILAARRLGATTPAAVVAATVWALCPRNTEPVGWISGRTDVLATALTFMGIAMWPWYADEEPRRARLRAAVAAALITLALLAKEVAIAGAIAVVIGTTASARGPKSRRLGIVARRLGYLVVPLIGYSVLRFAAIRDIDSNIPPLGARARIETFFEAMGRYVEMTLDPWHPATSIGHAGDLDRVRAAFGVVVVIAGGVLVVRAFLRRSAPSPNAVALGVAVAIGITALGLVVHIVPIEIAGSVAADRLLYLPLAGLALGLAVAASRLTLRGRRIAGALALALAASFVPVTRARSLDYTDELQFRVIAAEQAHPRNTSTTSGLANALLVAGEFDLACRLHGSARRLLAGTGQRGTLRHLDALENLGSCYEVIGDYDAAGAVYRELVMLHPDGGRVHAEIGYLHLNMFELDEAEVSFRRALELEPSLTPAHALLKMLPALRIWVDKLATEESRRNNVVAWARLLTSLGRVPDATGAWLAIALDPSTTNDSARTGTEFVLVNGAIADARRAVAAYSARGAEDAYVHRDRLRKRERPQRTIDVLRPRLEALAKP